MLVRLNNKIMSHKTAPYVFVSYNAVKWSRNSTVIILFMLNAFLSGFREIRLAQVADKTYPLMFWQPKRWGKELLKKKKKKRNYKRKKKGFLCKDKKRRKRGLKLCPKSNHKPWKRKPKYTLRLVNMKIRIQTIISTDNLMFVMVLFDNKKD